MFLNNIFQKFDHPPHLEKISQVDAPPFFIASTKSESPLLNNNFHVINQKGFIFVVVIAAVLRVCLFTPMHREVFICLEHLGLPRNRSTMFC